MNILVLSCSTGEGHNSAAKAIVEEFEQRGIKANFMDALSFGNHKAEKIVKSFFNGVAVKRPSMFGLMYKAGSIVSNPDIKSPIYYANITYSNNMSKYINENNIDVIVCTHLFPMEALTYLKKKNKIKAKCYAILTDYTAIPFIEETSMEGYFIPSNKLIKEFVDKKIAKKIIYPFGIPVATKFNNKFDKYECRNKLKLPQNKKIVLVMTGGVGCGKIEDMIDPLLRKTDDDTLFLVLTGKNDKLHKIISERYNNTKVRAIDFTDKVELYMDSSDLLLSKPGGLSSTEAAVKNIPLIHTFPIPGCETDNANFFSECGMSIAINTTDELIKKVIELLNNKRITEKMIDSQKKNINKYASRDIVNLILNNK